MHFFINIGALLKKNSPRGSLWNFFFPFFFLLLYLIEFRRESRIFFGVLTACHESRFFCFVCSVFSKWIFLLIVLCKKDFVSYKKIFKKKKKKNPRGSLFPFFGISSFSFKYKWIHVILFRGSPLLGIVLTFLFTFFPRGSQVFLKKNSESEGLASIFKKKFRIRGARLNFFFEIFCFFF